MKLDSARYEGGALILSTSDPEARRVAYKFKAGEYELVRRKRYTSAISGTSGTMTSFAFKTRRWRISPSTGAAATWAGW